MIHLKNVIQRYGTRTVLEIENLAIEAGTIVGLAGPNGSGKSTLLRLLAFLEAPAEGSITFDGAATSIRPNWVHKLVTLLVQEPYLLKRSVFANTAFGLKLRRKSDITTKVHKALNAVGLDPSSFANRQWFELSGGEAQRVALAARLVLKPKVLLMDEPTASLDTASAQLIRQAALGARDDYGATLVIASHDMTWLNAVADKTIHLEQGKIVEIR